MDYIIIKNRILQEKNLTSLQKIIISIYTYQNKKNISEIARITNRDKDNIRKSFKKININTIIGKDGDKQYWIKYCKVYPIWLKFLLPIETIILGVLIYAQGINKRMTLALLSKTINTDRKYIREKLKSLYFKMMNLINNSSFKKRLLDPPKRGDLTPPILYNKNKRYNISYYIFHLYNLIEKIKKEISNFGYPKFEEEIVLIKKEKEKNFLKDLLKEKNKKEIFEHKFKEEDIFLIHIGGNQMLKKVKKIERGFIKKVIEQKLKEEKEELKFIENPTVKQFIKIYKLVVSEFGMCYHEPPVNRYGRIRKAIKTLDYYRIKPYNYLRFCISFWDLICTKLNLDQVFHLDAALQKTEAVCNLYFRYYREGLEEKLKEQERKLPFKVLKFNSKQD